MKTFFNYNEFENIYNSDYSNAYIDENIIFEDDFESYIDSSDLEEQEDPELLFPGLDEVAEA